MSTAKHEDRVSILVVDDHPENIAALQGVLSRADYDIITASSGSEALRKILKHDFAVILLDVLMPGMDGFQTARLIRERDKSRDVPILFLTASGSDLAMIDRAYSVGAVDYLVKPLDAEVVRAKVAVFVELHRKSRRIQRQRDLERARSETELREREAEYQETFQGAPAGIAQLSPAGQLLRANIRFLELYGASWEDLEGKSFAGLFHPEDVPATTAALERLRKGATEPDTRVQRWVRKDGALLWVNRRVSLLRDAEGRPSRFIVVLDDLTDRLRAEEGQRLLARAGELLLSALEVKPALTSVAELAVPALGDGCAIYLTGEEDGAPLELTAQAGEGAERRCEELQESCGKGFPITLPDAESFPLMARGRALGSLVLIQDKNRKLDAHARSVARDLSQRVAFALDNLRLYQRSQEAIRLRDEFLSIASHELRTPLTPLQLYLQRLSTDREDDSRRPPLSPDKVRAALKAADRQVHRLSALVDNLLDVSRITMGRLELHCESMDLREVAGEIIGRFAEVGSGAGARLTLHDGSAVRGYWDRLRIEQVLTNLVSNALKYGDGRGVEVRVEGRDGQAHIEVRDEGIGIAPEELGRIFGRFERAVSAKHYGGLGLGLYITRQIVEAHGGEISVQSTPAKGSTFSVALPMVAEHARGEEESAALPH